MKAIILLNPHAGSGLALRRFRKLEPLLPELLGDFLVAITERPEELSEHLHLAAEAGYDTIFSLGGDGTNLAIVNALAEQPEHNFTMGTLPLGTGRDWARTHQIPYDPEAALRWLVSAKSFPIDLGRITFGQQQRLFLNVASAGLSGEVARRTNEHPVKRPWTFIQATVSTLLQFNAAPMRVTLDGEPWYEGDAFLLAVGNGRFFGRGMKICPDAFINDGLFDVVLVEGMPKLKALGAIPGIFRGTHVTRSDVHVRRARHVLVEGLGPRIGMEYDGDQAPDSQRIEFEVLPGALRMLLQPQVEALQPG
jgi:diacylglycerol kinase (ATP)